MRGRFNRPGYERVAKNRQAPAGRLSRLEAIVDEHSATLENVEGEGSVTVRKNYKGGLTIAAAGTGGGTGGEYTSYFKVYDASTDGCTFGVKDGSLSGASSTYCGRVFINGKTGVWVAKKTQELDADGDYAAWLFAWVDESTGAGAEVVIAAGLTAPTAPVVATPANMLAKGAILLGRCTAATPSGGSRAITAVNQDYLRGGDAQMLLLGECGADVVVDL